MIELPDEIIDFILQKSNIKCHQCNLKLNKNFWKKQGNFYFCSKNCYEKI